MRDVRLLHAACLASFLFLLSRFAEPLSHATDTTVACASLRRTRPSFESFLALRAFMCVCRCFWVFFFSRPRRSLSLSSVPAASWLAVEVGSRFFLHAREPIRRAYRHS